MMMKDKKTGIIHLVRQFISILIGIWNKFRGNNEELKDKRLQKCVKCPQLSYDNMFYCALCDCAVELKARVKKEECPISFW
tara:strand:- start:701 stop:943 length:243 start_codon:yes stop_codon:yes gene_type:complete